MSSSSESPSSPPARESARSSGLLATVVVVLALAAIAATLVTRSRLRRDAEESRGSPASGFVPLSIEAAAELQSVATRIEIAWRTTGAPPRGLRGLPADDESGLATARSAADPPVDRWGKEYVWVRDESEGRDGWRLTSLGADGEPGGVGSDQDLSLWVFPPERESAEQSSRSAAE